jgi:glycosyltransferase involved in cell wall biosynthesis
MPEGIDANRASAAPVSLIVVSHSYPPVLGGSEIEAQRVCAALIHRGHRVTVLCAGGPPMPDTSHWLDPAGVPVRIFARRSNGRLKDYAFALGVAWTLFKERRNYQLVSGSSIVTIMRSSWMGRLELRWLQAWAWRVMILNEGMAEEARAAGLEPQRLLWMPNPVDTDAFAPCGRGRKQEIRARLDIPAEAAAVIFTGRLASEKELSSLIGAFEAVVRRMPCAVLILLGDGPSRGILEERARQLGLSASVRFTGYQPAADIPGWLQASDLFTLVSSNEGFPCSLVEAMSAGMACVVSDIPANAQLIDSGVHGLRVPVGDEACIAEAIAGLLGDPGSRARMGTAARLRVIENYSTDKVVGRYEALFEGALRASKATNDQARH